MTPMPTFNLNKQPPKVEFNPRSQESSVLIKSLIVNSMDESKNPNDPDENYSLPLEVELFDATEIPNPPFPTYEEVLEQQKRNNPEAFRKK
jgi:hypothetical protein